MTLRLPSELFNCDNSIFLIQAKLYCRLVLQSLAAVHAASFSYIQDVEGGPAKFQENREWEALCFEAAYREGRTITRPHFTTAFKILEALVEVGGLLKYFQFEL